jgi:8-oxo-dGTP diphosphatase
MPQLSSTVQLATLCYIRKNKKTLLLHRDKNPEDVHFGKWNGLGGKFQAGETPEICVKREIKEESNLDIYMPKMAGILTFPQFSHGKDWYVFVFTADTFDGKVVSNDEGSLCWIDDSEILNLPLWEGDQVFLPLVLEGTFFSGNFLYKEGSLVNHEIVIY